MWVIEEMEVKQLAILDYTAYKLGKVYIDSYCEVITSHTLRLAIAVNSFM